MHHWGESQQPVNLRLLLVVSIRLDCLAAGAGIWSSNGGDCSASADWETVDYDRSAESH